MAKEAILNGESVVCKHTKKWINAARLEFNLTEGEVVERMLNGYVHSWHIQFEVPLNSTFAALADSIRDRIAPGGSDDE